MLLKKKDEKNSKNGVFLINIGFHPPHSPPNHPLTYSRIFVLVRGK